MSNTKALESKAQAIQSKPALWVEYPCENETIVPPHYSFQVASAPGAGEIEVSIDHGDWLPCRESLGLWWYDWTGFDAGLHQVVARARTLGGIHVLSAPREFRVG